MTYPLCGVIHLSNNQGLTNYASQYEEGGTGEKVEQTIDMLVLSEATRLSTSQTKKTLNTRQIGKHTQYLYNETFISFLIRGWFLSLLCFEDTNNNLLFLNQEGPDYPAKRRQLSLVS